MSTAVATNKPNSGVLAIPQDLAALFGSVAPNIVGGEKVPTLSIGGKVWKVVKDGNETPITMKVDGESMPAPTVTVILLNQVQKRSRAYFEGAYTEGSNKAPDCYSTEGEYPDSDVKEPQCSNCAGCPQAVKGSKINESGDATTACAVSKRVAVVPSSDPNFTALLLKLSVTSLWEAEPKEEAQGWYAFDAYMKFLKSNGVNHTAAVKTKMKFDSNVKYPKVLFKYEGLISVEEGQVIVPRIESEEVKHVLGLDKVASGKNDKSVEGQKQVESNPAATEPTKNEVAAEAAAAKKAEEKAKAAAKAKVDKEAAEAKAKADAEAKKAAEKPVVVTNDDELASVLASWE